MGGFQLAIVIPCHNEAATLGDVVEKAVAFGHVIVVDDRSTIVQSVPLDRFTWTASFTLVRERGWLS